MSDEVDQSAARIISLHMTLMALLAYVGGFGIGVGCAKAGMTTALWVTPGVVAIIALIIIARLRRELTKRRAFLRNGEKP